MWISSIGGYEMMMFTVSKWLLHIVCCLHTGVARETEKHFQTDGGFGILGHYTGNIPVLIRNLKFKLFSFYF